MVFGSFVCIQLIPAGRPSSLVLPAKHPIAWCHGGVTVVLQWCYSGVTVVLQWCKSGVPVVLQQYALSHGTVSVFKACFSRSDAKESSREVCF
jgi:hypothetical protein